MRCDYCYNKDIVFAKEGSHTFIDVLEFLKTRVGLLEAVVLSGGEATMHDLEEFCFAIKELGFKIKLDTNGTDFTQVKKLIELNLLDFVALDYKAPKEKFSQITHSNKYEEFSKTLDFLIESKMNFEARTTLHSDLLNTEDINSIIIDLKQRGYKNDYFIQMFQDTEINIANLKAPKSTFDKSQLLDELNIIWR